MISVIVPTFNEGAHIERCLAALRKDFEGEIIVVDGASEDDTTSRARAYATEVLCTEKGLARQCNRAAERASGALIFLVAADSVVPENWAGRIQQVMENPKVALGGFRLAIQNPSPIFRLIAWASNQRARKEKVAFIDQGLFVRRLFWNQVGGLPETSRLPFAKFCHSLRSEGEFVLAPDVTLTSPRKWEEHGTLRTTFGHLREFRRFKREELLG